MRYIKKKGDSGCFPLNQAHNNPPQDKAEARSQWGSFRDKSQLTALLGKEQYFLCAYSEIEILRDNSTVGTHIEHVKPKSRYPQQTFDYKNLVLSALSSEDLKSTIAQREVFGGHHKKSHYDPTLFVSCLDNDCTDYFSYLSDGRVVPKDNDDNLHRKKAEYTIKLLNLNSPYLVNKRRDWLDVLNRCIADPENELEH